MVRMKSQEVKRENSRYWSRVAWTPWKNIIGESDPDSDKVLKKKVHVCEEKHQLSINNLIHSMISSNIIVYYSFPQKHSFQ